MSDLRRTVEEKLVRALGEEQAAEVLRDVLSEVGLDDIVTPEDCLVVGDALIGKSGILRVIGGSIRVKALASGAELA